ncbi:MAG: hybrid sensor histidine kinase/response regulator [Desulfatibacillaceae bacterium]|nr:hybrid sensor histidine kinase/response regulator [Desulfatibacillaceae bacterium]
MNFSVAKNTIKNILLVDDEPGIRKVLSSILADEGFCVQTAPDAQTALETFKNIQPCVVLTDIKMPGHDGLWLLDRIKTQDPGVEVIMITGHGDMDLAVESLKHQASDFITKPVSDDALKVALERAARRIALRRQLESYTQGLEHMVEEKTQKLLEAQRMAAVGQTAAALAHTIRNIAGSLKGGAFVLEKGLELDDRDYLIQGWEMVKNNVERISRLAMDLLHYAKSDAVSPEPVDPDAPARSAVEALCGKAQQSGVSLYAQYAGPGPALFMDEKAISLCLQNLLDNAVDACLSPEATPGEKTVNLSVRRISGKGVSYEIADSGPGMDSSVQSKIFSEFFTTKGKNGTGVGLLLTQKIARRHNGDVSFISEPGKGSVFTLHLPGAAS